MNDKSRTDNSIRNVISGIGSQVFILIITFLSRTLFIKILGAEYLGINGLYSNILTLLSLAELGIGNVMVFSLYKPIKDNDKETISKYINFYKSVYRIIAITILILGLSLVPFLDNIIESELDKTDLIIYYILFLLNTVFSYIATYKTTLIKADQKRYIESIAKTKFTIIQNIVQLICIWIFKNYYIYLIIQMSCTLFYNLYLQRKAQKMYPFIDKHVVLEKERKKETLKNVKDTFLYKLGEVLLNSTDNLLISVMLGTIIVGYYSNYSMIISAISLIITTMATAISASVGNLNTQEDSKQNYKIFNVLVYLFNFITTVGMIGFFLVINDFIKVWIGDSYILSTDVVLAIAISFYISNSQSPIWMYREALGLFKEVKYTGLAAAIINLVLSIILGKIIGLAGILIATPISKLCTTSIFEPIIIFKKSFHMSTKKYFVTQIKYFCMMILALSISIFVCHFVQLENIFVKMILKGIISVVISVIICILLTRKTEEYKELKSRAMDKLKFIKVKG